MKFKLQKHKLDENKDYSLLEGKITVKEMVKAQKRIMKTFSGFPFILDLNYCFQ